MRAPSPTYFCTSSEPMTRMKQASVRLATARADSVLPVPGGLVVKLWIVGGCVWGEGGVGVGGYTHTDTQT